MIFFQYICIERLYTKMLTIALAGVAPWIECWPASQKGHSFDSQSGHIPGLQARSPVGHLGMRGNHTLMFLSLSFPLLSPL